MNERQLGVAIVGCGLIGHKRATALAGGRLVACADLSLERARTLARLADGAVATAEWQEAIRHPRVDVVVIATTHDVLAPISCAAIDAGKAVLVEKPAARSVRELDVVIEAAARAKVPVRVGFNHRYHPALRKARELQEAGELGELMFVRGRYGHGARLGYEREWRADPERSGGGELMDQGVHLIDLARSFLGPFAKVSGTARTYYWPMSVDDNAFLTLETAGGQVAFLHVSCTEWKNTFSLEVYGKKAKLHIEGLGGSYGLERLAFYRMLPQMGPPETTIWEYPMADDSWNVEMAEFMDEIRRGRHSAVGLGEARAVLEVVETIYGASPVASMAAAETRGARAAASKDR
jgi:predicted dehydrogenase